MSFGPIRWNRCQVGTDWERGGPAKWKATSSSAVPSVMFTRSGSEMREAARPTDEIGRPRLVSKSISLKLRIRAVVWKRGAHQPGGPPLRTTTVHHFRSSPPGMDAEAGCVGTCETLGPEPDVFPTVRRRQALHSIRMPENQRNDTTF